jgi:ParB family chromosome partitioning protein
MIALPLWENLPQAPQEGNNEWYTPARYIKAAREVMGGIDLDPASCALANERIRAARYYTQEDNGLSQEWYGRVWLNPPYGKQAGKPSSSLQSEFIAKLLQEWRHGNIEQAILLSTADLDEKWFQPLWNFPLCIAYPAIVFDRLGLPADKHIMGSCFTYLGPNESKFIEVFSLLGIIVRRVAA